MYQSSTGDFLRIWNIPREKINESRSVFEGRLKMVENAVKALTDRRDMIIAHLDRKLVTQDPSISPEPIYSKDLEELFESLFDILGEYLWYLKGTDLQKPNLKKRLPEQFEYLISRLNND